MAQWVSAREFSRIVGYSDAQVKKWIDKGHISENSIDASNPQRRKINVEKAQADLARNYKPNFAKNSDPEKRAKTRHNKQQRVQAQEIDPKELRKAKLLGIAPPVRIVPEQVPHGKKGKNSIDLDNEQKQINIKLLNVKLDEAQKRLVSRDAVYDALFKAGQELRIAFEAVPDRVIDDIMLSKTRNDAYNVLEKELNMVLTRFANVGKDI